MFTSAHEKEKPMNLLAKPLSHVLLIAILGLMLFSESGCGKSGGGGQGKPNPGPVICFQGNPAPRPNNSRPPQGGEANLGTKIVIAILGEILDRVLNDGSP
jgi:hypothetical protein